MWKYIFVTILVLVAIRAILQSLSTLFGMPNQNTWRSKKEYREKRGNLRILKKKENKSRTEGFDGGDYVDFEEVD